MKEGKQTSVVRANVSKGAEVVVAEGLDFRALGDAVEGASQVGALLGGDLGRGRKHLHVAVGFLEESPMSGGEREG